MTTQRGFERLIASSDAVVAIALTLLVLPLVGVRRVAGRRRAGASPAR